MTAAMIDHLPQEILIEILIRLPIKSLVRLRLASKWWNSLITSPLFIAAHLRHSVTGNAANPLILLRSCFHLGKSEFYSVRSDDASFTELTEVELPYESLNKCFYVVGSCNGVVCLLDDFKCFTQNLILWNPSIRKGLKLPPPFFSCHIRGPYLAVIGFGFDSKTNDYKVVRVVNVWKTKEKKPQARNLKRPVKVEVYSPNVGSWRTLDVSVPPCRMQFGKLSQALINGIVHWLAFREVNGKNHIFVLTFDLSNECFGEMPLPESLAGGSIGDISLSVFEQSLAVLETRKRGSFDLWTLKEYGVRGSWSKNVIVNSRFSFSSVAFRNNGDLLFIKQGGIVSYNCQSKKSVRCKCKMTDGDELCFHAGSFVESLGLLNVPSHIKPDEKPSLKRKFSTLLEDVVKALDAQTEQAVNSGEASDHSQKVLAEVMDYMESLGKNVKRCYGVVENLRTGLRAGSKHQIRASLEHTSNEIQSNQAKIDRLSQVVQRVVSKYSGEGCSSQDYMVHEKESPVSEDANRTSS